MKRRNLIKGTIATVGLYYSYPTLAQQGSRQRRDIASFNDNELRIYREAILIMQAKPASDPASWNYLAGVHHYWKFTSNADAVAKKAPADLLKTINYDALGAVPEGERTKFWATCIHHDKPLIGHFLSWHRLYLWHFETALLAAMETAAAKLGLAQSVAGIPYWDYYRSPQLPDAFRKPLAQGRPNPLNVPFRKSGFNEGTSSMPAFSLDAFIAGNTLDQHLMIDGESFDGFSGALENTIHDQVHGELGGLMGHPHSAAWDPIFWLHHANIDRLWAIWQKRTTAAPDTSLSGQWRQQGFKFKKNIKGDLFSASAGEAADVKGFAPQSITYDNMTPPPKTPVTPLPKVPPLIKVASGSHTQKMGTNALTGDVKKVAVTNSGGTVRLNLPAGSRSKLGTLGTKSIPPGGGKALTWAAVVLEGISITEQGQRDGFVYQVYLNLPSAPGSGADPEAHKIGTLNAFKLSCSDPDICTSGKASVRFVITDKLVKMINNKTPSDAVDISLVRITAAGADGKPVPPPDSPALLEIAAMRLEGSDDPVM